MEVRDGGTAWPLLTAEGVNCAGVEDVRRASFVLAMRMGWSWVRPVMK